MTKDKEIRENIRDIFSSLDNDSQLAKWFVKELFEHKEIADSLHKLVQAKVDSEIRVIKEEGIINFSDKLVKENNEK